MLSEDKIIAIYCFVDDLLKGTKRQEDIRRKVSDSEIITSAIVSALYFGGHLENGRHFMKMTGLSPLMLDKSRFNRRLHALSDLLFQLFFQIGQHLKTVAGASDYVVDSFPVSICDNIRINRCKILKGEQFRGKHASMRRYFYGVKVQVLTTTRYTSRILFCTRK